MKILLSFMALLGSFFSLKIDNPLQNINYLEPKMALNANNVPTNEVELDLYNLGIDTSAYTKDSETELLLFAEVKEELYFYVFNYATGQDFANITFSSRGANDIEALNETEYTYNSCSLNYYASSENKQFVKYKVLDYEIESEYKYRQYDLHKLNFEISGDVYVSLEDSYIFHTEDDGSITYTKRGYSYLSLSDVTVYNLLLNQSNPLENWFGYNLYGRYTSWYGFNCDNYKIEDLLEIQITALEYDLEFYTSEDYQYSFMFQEADEQVETLYKINPEVKEYEKRGFFSKEICSWNQILKISDIETMHEEGNLSDDIYNFANDYFAKNEFLVNFADFEYSANAGYAVSSFSWDPNSGFHDELNPLIDFSTMSEDDKICYQLWNNYYNRNFPAGFPSTSQGYSYNKITTKGNSSAQAVRMKFIDIEDNYYDLAVITDPKDSSGTIGDGGFNEFNDAMNEFANSWNNIISTLHKGLLHVQNFFNVISDFFIQYPWVGYSIIAFFALLIIYKFIRWIQK